ncbi:MAG: tetratricopeptide repeat protein [Promethearchaeota archaeon]
MNEQNIIEESEEYSHINRLIIEGKHVKALQLIDKNMKKEELLLHDILLYKLLKCDILYQQGLWEDVINLAEQIYQESLGREDSLLSIDALLKMAEGLIFLNDPTKFKDIIEQCMNKLNNQIKKESLEYKKKEANILYVKGFFYCWQMDEADKALELLEQSVQSLESIGDIINITKPLLLWALVLVALKAEYDQAFKLAERSLTISKKYNYKFTYAFGLFIMGMIYSLKADSDNAIKLLEESIIKFKELNNTFFTIFALNYIGSDYMAKGDLDIALEYSRQSLTHARNTKNKRQIAEISVIMAAIYGLKGENDQSIHLNKQGLELFRELDLKRGAAAILNNLSGCYIVAGDLEQALKSIESSIAINSELGYLMDVANNYDFLIRILIEKGELARAHKSLEELKQMKNQLNNDFTNKLYLFDKALLLNTSSRARDKGKAEEILKQTVTQENLGLGFISSALLILCELLLTELQMTNDLEVLEELNFYTNKLLEISKKSRSYYLFAETYFLKAKLSLLTLDINTARRFLTQAQRIAERFGLNQLATKISTEHNNLREKLYMWRDLEKREFSLSERIKLAGLDTHMKDVLQKSAMISTQISEHKVTIHKEQKICLVCKGEISGFMYTCNCDALYCENCARALTDLENACWVCGAPIDISKPTKPYKIEKFGKKDIIKKSPKKP